MNNREIIMENYLHPFHKETKNEEEYLYFKTPSWFLEDVTTNKKYTNSSLAMINTLKDLEDNNEK